MSDHDRGTDRKLDDLLRSSTPGFEPGFADRVLSRVEEERLVLDSADLLLRRHFSRVAPLAVAASLALAAFNASRASSDTGQTVTEAILGLEPVSVQSVYQVSLPGAETEGES